MVIPTFNRTYLLQRTLSKLNEQTLAAEDGEIIVISDGSTDSTEQICEEFKKTSKYNFQFLKQENKGQAAARNNGIDHTTGEIILIIGDDIIPQKNDFLEWHVKIHQKYPNIIIIGETRWHPELKITPFMTWLEEGTFKHFSKGGAMVAFNHLKKRPIFDNKFLLHEADLWHFYGGNISIPAEILKKEKFSTDFNEYGWEDTELGARLLKQGLKIFFTELAPAYHHHEVTEEDFFKRMETVRKTAEIFEQKHPDIKVLPHGLKKLIFQIVSSSFFLALWEDLPGKFFQQLFWWAKMKKIWLAPVAPATPAGPQTPWQA